MGEPVFLEPQKELVLFRITQEALNNILKHANATNIILKLEYHPASIDLCVQDDGVGFTPNSMGKHEHTHMTAGLTNMRTRANLINGICNIESVPYSGTKILVTAPV
jgi:two-component system NarL family sensor kinase